MLSTRVSTRRCCQYYCFQFCTQVDPFTSVLPERLFNMSRLFSVPRLTRSHQCCLNAYSTCLVYFLCPGWPVHIGVAWTLIQHVSFIFFAQVDPFTSVLPERLFNMSRLFSLPRLTRSHQCCLRVFSIWLASFSTACKTGSRKVCPSSLPSIPWPSRARISEPTNWLDTPLSVSRASAFHLSFRRRWIWRPWPSVPSRFRILKYVGS